MSYALDNPGTMAVGLISRSDIIRQDAVYLPELKAALGIDLSVTDYDADLTRKLKTAINAVEQYCSIGMQPQTVTVVYGSYTPGEPLPFGPVWTAPTVVITPRYEGSTVTITDSTGMNLSEGDFPHLTGRFPGGKVVYKGGYSRDNDPVYDENQNLVKPADPYPVPDGLIGAVLEHAATSFRSGGISGGDAGQYWKTLAGPFRRF